MVGENNKVVIVTGGSSGIGRCTASALKENGCIVYEFSRRNIPMEGVTHLSVDVTNEDAVNAAVQQVIQKEAKIDAVINCAGFGISGAVEFTSMEQAKAQFDVNFFGTVTVNKTMLMNTSRVFALRAMLRWLRYAIYFWATSLRALFMSSISMAS